MNLAQKIILLEEIIKPKDSLGIERKDMPQIGSKNINSFLKYLEKKNIAHEKCTMQVSGLKPSQAELDTDKADKMYAESNKSEGQNPLQIPVFISNNDYVLDGHHRWLALKRNEEEATIPCIRINSDAKSCLDIMHGFEKTTRRDINDRKVVEALLDIYYANTSEIHEDKSEYVPVGIAFDKLKKNKVNLTNDERQVVKDGGAEWSDGRSAIMKSVINGEEYFTTYTHRAYNCCKTLKEAIKRFHVFIKETA